MLQGLYLNLYTNLRPPYLLVVLTSPVAPPVFPYFCPLKPGPFRLSSKLQHQVRDLYVLLSLVLYRHFEDYVLLVAWDRLFTDGLHKCAQPIEKVNVNIGDERLRGLTSWAAYPCFYFADRSSHRAG